MTCREAIDFLMDYLDNTLPGETRSAFDHHLTLCPSCVAFLDSYRQTLSLEKSLSHTDCDDAHEALPDELVQAILTAMRGRAT